MKARIYHWHRKLSIIAGIVTLLWIGSGLLHPFMAYWGPRPASFAPPVQELQKSPSRNGFSLMLDQLQGHDVTQLRLVKVRYDWAWQVSTRAGFKYYDPDFGYERKDFATPYAEYLAYHYAGSDRTIKDISTQTEFDLSYAPISRLLPVYKVRFNDPHDLVAYVDPTSDRLGSLTDNVKVAALSTFQFIHTLSFLDPAEAVRALLVLFSVLMILAISGLGMALRVSMKPRLQGQKPRILHGIFAYIVWLPVLMMTLSGIFHLIVRSPLVSDPPLPAQTVFNIETDIALPDIDAPFNDLRLVSRDGDLFWRLAAADKVSYFEARRGQEILFSEEEWAKGFLEVASGEPQKITSFTDEYGFAYKRLPVWRFENDGRISFVDPLEGLVAASVSAPEVVETWSFTRFHKWQFLDPFTGRMWRDVIVVSVGLMIAAMAITGLILRLRRRG